MAGAPRALGLAITWASNCLGLLVATALVPGLGYGGNPGTLMLAGLILALVNFALRPVVIVMALPALILTLGVALLLVNTLMLWLTAAIVPGLHVGGFFSTLTGAIVISLVNIAVRHWTGTSAASRGRGHLLRWRSR